MEGLRRKVPGPKELYVGVLVCTCDEVRFLIDALDSFAKSEPLFELRRPKLDIGRIRETLVNVAYGKLPDARLFKP